MALLEFSEKGIYCPQADVYIDPWKKVNKALITHGHADHLKAGMTSYLCTPSAAPVIRHRINAAPGQVQTARYGEQININGVSFSFHPAGHILGSAQIRAEYKGEIWVASGDYKTEDDGLCEAFEPVRCHTFITETTFGLPIFKWKKQEILYQEINQWWQQNRANGVSSIISAYALGKAQRILHGLDTSIGPVFCHASVEHVNRIIRNQGIDLPYSMYVTPSTPRQLLKGALVFAPPAVINSNWINRFAPYEIALASGWTALQERRKRKGHDVSFTLSDHADWSALNQAVEACGAETVYTTHGYSDAFATWLRSKGFNAQVADIQFNGDEE